MAKQHHVVPQDGGWAVRTDHAERASKVTHTKAEATAFARQVSQNQGTELVIHNKDGRISGKDSHGNDPYPPKG
nr:DUF2188 domain-containing protein [uncultured Dethiosulfovibrio sp.]